MKRDYRELRQLANAFHDRFSELNYDTGMSLAQKFNILLEYFKNIAKDWESVLEYLKDFEEKFDENLYNSVNDILNEWIGSGIFEELINEKIWSTILEQFKDYFPSVKDYGAKGDGVTLDDEAFERALSENSFMNVTNGTYRISHLPRYDNLKLNGIGEVVIILDAHLVQNSNTPLLEFGNNSNFTNITFKSEPISREWNRGNLQERNNVYISKCSFYNFAHVSTTPNAWGLYLDKTENCYITDCYFEDNTQSDIAIVEGCKNIYIQDCRGKALHINVEPNTPNPRGQQITIENCIVSKLDLQENTFTSDSYDMVNVLNCNIKNLKYRGLNTSFVNCVIDDYSTFASNNPDIGDVYFGGVIQSTNSLMTSENLISDPYYNDLSMESATGVDTEWGFYTATSFANSFDRKTDKNGKYFAINPNQNTASSFIIRSKRKIQIKPNTWYLVKTIYQPKLNADTGYYRSIHTRLRMYDPEGVQIGNTKNISTNRFLTNPVKNLEQSAIIYSGEATQLQFSSVPSIGANEDGLLVYGVGVYEITKSGKRNVDLKPQDRIRQFSTTENLYTTIFENNDTIMGKDTDAFYKKVWRNGAWKTINFDA